MDSILILSEFRGMFHTDFPCMPSDRDIDFWIDLEGVTYPISIYPYRMDLAKLERD